MISRLKIYLHILWHIIQGLIFETFILVTMFFCIVYYRFGAIEVKTEIKTANAASKRVYLIMMVSNVECTHKIEEYV